MSDSLDISAVLRHHRAALRIDPHWNGDVPTPKNIDDLFQARFHHVRPRRAVVAILVHTWLLSMFSSMIIGSMNWTLITINTLVLGCVTLPTAVLMWRHREDEAEPQDEAMMGSVQAPQQVVPTGCSDEIALWRIGCFVTLFNVIWLGIVCGSKLGQNGAITIAIEITAIFVCTAHLARSAVICAVFAAVPFAAWVIAAAPSDGEWGTVSKASALQFFPICAITFGIGFAYTVVIQSLQKQQAADSLFRVREEKHIKSQAKHVVRLWKSFLPPPMFSLAGKMKLAFGNFQDVTQNCSVLSVELHGGNMAVGSCVVEIIAARHNLTIANSFKSNMFTLVYGLPLHVGSGGVAVNFDEVARQIVTEMFHHAPTTSVRVGRGNGPLQGTYVGEHGMRYVVEGEAVARARKTAQLCTPDEGVPTTITYEALMGDAVLGDEDETYCLFRKWLKDPSAADVDGKIITDNAALRSSALSHASCLAVNTECSWRRFIDPSVERSFLQGRLRTLQDRFYALSVLTVHLLRVYAIVALLSLAQLNGGTSRWWRLVVFDALMFTSSIVTLVSFRWSSASGESSIFFVFGVMMVLLGRPVVSLGIVVVGCCLDNHETVLYISSLLFVIELPNILFSTVMPTGGAKWPYLIVLSLVVDMITFLVPSHEVNNLTALEPQETNHFTVLWAWYKILCMAAASHTATYDRVGFYEERLLYRTTQLSRSLLAYRWSLVTDILPESVALRLQSFNEATETREVSAAVVVNIFGWSLEDRRKYAQHVATGRYGDLVFHDWGEKTWRIVAFSEGSDAVRVSFHVALRLTTLSRRATCLGTIVIVAGRCSAYLKGLAPTYTIINGGHFERMAATYHARVGGPTSICFTPEAFVLAQNFLDEAHIRVDLPEGQVCDIQDATEKAQSLEPTSVSGTICNCPKGHPMARLQHTKANSVSCGVCRLDIVFKNGFCHCVTCGYDMCDSCVCVRVFSEAPTSAALASRSAHHASMETMNEEDVSFEAEGKTLLGDHLRHQHRHSEPAVVLQLRAEKEAAAAKTAADKAAAAKAAADKAASEKKAAERAAMLVRVGARTEVQFASLVPCVPAVQLGLEGGYGKVSACTLDGVVVVVKLPCRKPGYESDRALRKEISVLNHLHQSLCCRNIVVVRGVTFAPGDELALVMPHYQSDLRRYLLSTPGRPADDIQWLKVAVDLSGAVAGIHAVRISHLDIKPANVLLDDEEHAFLADFGTASRIGKEHFGSVMVQGVNTNTVRATTPEYCTNLEDETDIQKDVFALCKTLLDIRTGVCKQVCELPNVLADDIVKRKFLDVHWGLLTRGLSTTLSERPTAYEVFYALQNGTLAPAPPPPPARLQPELNDDVICWE